jgi:hypothetical protein
MSQNGSKGPKHEDVEGTRQGTRRSYLRIPATGSDHKHHIRLLTAIHSLASTPPISAPNHLTHTVNAENPSKQCTTSSQLARYTPKVRGNSSFEHTANLRHLRHEGMGLCARAPRRRRKITVRLSGQEAQHST